MISVEVKNLSKKFGSTEVLKDVGLQVQHGEFLVLVGPSGCGKSTLLRIIAGLEEMTSGEVRIDGRVVNDVDPKDRDIGMVFQSYALYPHMNVAENMGFGLKVRGADSEEIRKRVREAADLLKLSHLLERRPKELSGGQRQRVALGRAIVRQAKVFLFDEPLSNLDAKLRNEMRVEIKRLHRILGNTMIYVTHDQVEATTMGDRIAVLNEGVVQQIGTTRDLYLRPANQFVAGFIGVPEMNMIRGRIGRDAGANSFNSTDGSIILKGEKNLLAADAQDAVLGIRPECLSLTLPGSAACSIEATVDFIENMGSHNLIHMRSGNNLLRAFAPLERNTTVGERVGLEIASDRSLFFNTNTGKAIGRSL